MKQYFISACLLSVVFVATAQQGSKFFIEPSVGIAFPVYDFKGDNTGGSYNTDGWAKAGPFISLSGGYQLNKQFGVIALAGFQQNPVSKEPLTEMLRKSYLDSIIVSTGKYKIKKFLAGGYGTTLHSSSQKVWVEMKLLAGVSKIIVPENTYAAFAHANPSGSAYNFIIYKIETIAKEQRPPVAFACQVDAALNYKIGEKIFIVLTGGLFNTSASYRNKYRMYSENGGPWETEEGYTAGSTLKRSITTITASAGVKISLN